MKYVAIDEQGCFAGLGKFDHETLWSRKENQTKMDLNVVYNPEDDGFFVSRIVVGTKIIAIGHSLLKYCIFYYENFRWKSIASITLVL